MFQAQGAGGGARGVVRAKGAGLCHFTGGGIKRREGRRNG